MKQKSRKGISIDILYLPAVILLTVFVVYPLLSGVQISFTNWNGYSSTYKYIGFANYKKMFHDKMFYTALKNTVIYGVGSTTLQTIIGISYALLLQKRFPGQTLARVIIYLPAMIASLIMGYISYFLVQYNHGAINDIMIALGKEPVDWMANGERAVWIIVVINALQFVGKTMIVMIAGLQGIPDSYNEAASIDGAAYLQRLRYITLPLLLPAITTSVVLNLIGGLKLFGIILATTSGGPGYSSHSLSTLINYLYFQNQNAGYSSSVGLFLFLIIMILGTIVRNFLEKKAEGIS
ncbi:carbohydrate ABC transporter permease [Sporofaciens musculi]|jgi:raffinose/stachyose/melibiose transport system permease protein|uniref:carbohydrate ABC transporter permease n=1 Tax=Sporofaciens musculi TaxID=2681861 RepID=UPI00259CF8B5|nr:sugar ABC transporter permease [Sporofaciens musculi]